MDDITVRIGDTAQAMGDRFVRAWRDAENGQAPAAAPTVVFENWQTFVATFSEARIALLNHLSAAGPSDSIGALAGKLGRPYRRVRDDVTALIAVGLLERTGTRVGLAAGGAVTRIDFTAAPT